MPCPHYKITIIKRRNNESAVSAACQSGEKLFSEYDQEQKYYPYKTEVTHKEIMLPSHVPPEYADRNTLWNSAGAQEKQWNSQLARRFVLAIPREIPQEQYADLIRDYCRVLLSSVPTCSRTGHCHGSVYRHCTCFGACHAWQLPYSKFHWYTVPAVRVALFEDLRGSDSRKSFIALFDITCYNSFRQIRMSRDSLRLSFPLFFNVL